jgi:hypothetical protein
MSDSPPLNKETKGQKGQNDAALHVVFAGSSYTLLTVSILREGSWSFIAYCVGSHTRHLTDNKSTYTEVCPARLALTFGHRAHCLDVITR